MTGGAKSSVLTLVLIVFALPNLSVELGANLVHQLGEARGPISSGRDTSHASMRIHGHFATSGQALDGREADGGKIAIECSIDD